MEEDEIEENIHHYDTKYDVICEEIYLEYPILQKLLYRNANQHGNTVVYQYLRIISKSMKNLTRDRLQLLNTCVKEALKYNLNMKVTSIEVDKLLAALQLAQLVIDEISKVIHYCLKAATVLQIQLAKRFFVGFYGLLYGMLAKIADGFIQLVTRFHSDFSSILELLQHYAIVNQKVANLISTRLKSIHLHPQTNALISLLKGKPTPKINQLIPITNEKEQNFSSLDLSIEEKTAALKAVLTSSDQEEAEKEVEETEETNDEDLGISTKPLSAPKLQKVIPTVPPKSKVTGEKSITQKDTAKSSSALNIIKVKTPNKRKLFSPEAFQVSPSVITAHQKLSIPPSSSSQITPPTFPPEKKMKIEKSATIAHPEKQITHHPKASNKSISSGSSNNNNNNNKNKNNGTKNKKHLDDIDAIFSGLF